MYELIFIQGRIFLWGCGGSGGGVDIEPFHSVVTTISFFVGWKLLLWYTFYHFLFFSLYCSIYRYHYQDYQLRKENIIQPVSSSSFWPCKDMHLKNGLRPSLRCAVALVRQMLSSPFQTGSPLALLVFSVVISFKHGYAILWIICRRWFPLGWEFKISYCPVH